MQGAPRNLLKAVCHLLNAVHIAALGGALRPRRCLQALPGKVYPGVASRLEQRGNAAQLLHRWVFMEHPDTALTRVSQASPSRGDGSYLHIPHQSFFFPLVIIAEMVFSVKKSLAGNA